MSSFDWQLMMILIGASLPGILIGVPKVLQATIKSATIKGMIPTDRPLPSTRTMVMASVIQTLILVAGGAALGTALAHRVGLGAPFFEALITGELVWNALRPQLLPTLYFGIGGALILIAAYYLVFRPWLDTDTVSAMEGLRMGTGIWVRILYGGIVEEVLMRWGLMTFLVWLGWLITGAATPAVVWSAIVISGLLFGIGHFPALIAMGCKKTPAFFTTEIVQNLGAGMIFGWLFWQYGLASAILTHMLFHLVSYPFDLRLSRAEHM